MRKTLCTIAFLALIYVVLVGTSQAIFPSFITKEWLIANCQDIVFGKVSDIHCEWSEDHQLIFTFAKIQILEQWKGDTLGNEITVQAQGG
jgi:hypothetical protein